MISSGLFSQTLQSSLETRQDNAQVSLLSSTKHVWCTFNYPSPYLSRSYLDVEVAPLIGDLEDLWPGKAVDPQPITVNQQAIGTDTQHYVNPFRILQPSRDSKEA